MRPALRQGGTGRWALLALATGLAAGCLAAAPGVASAASEPEFCAGEVVRDDERPLRRMPAERPPPEGELPFGPRNLSMYRLNFGSKVVLEGSHLGYRFAAKGGEGRILRLGWIVRAVLLRVDRKGRVLGTAGTTARRLGEVEGLDSLQFSFPASSGLYRIDISFANLKGKRLASYREHFRVVPRRVGMRLALAAETLRPGEVAYARAIDTGTVPVAFQPGLGVEREEGGAWVSVAAPAAALSNEERFRWTLAGGEASPCVAFAVPNQLGSYRFTASALVYGTYKRRTITAPFEVVAADD